MIGVIVLFTSCQPSITHQLNSIEKLMNEHLDSALTYLAEIDLNGRISKRDRAHYALLQSIAWDKNYIDVTNDSLISIASDYYNTSGNQYDRMRSLYYHGIVKMNAGDYPSAIVYFEKALQEASELKNLRYVGLIHKNMGNVFNVTNNYSESIKHTKEAILAYEKNNDTLYASYAKYYLAVYYLNKNVLDSCQLLLNDLRCSVGEGPLLSRSSLKYARTLSAQGDSLQVALRLYRETPNHYFSMLDYGFYALAFSKIGQRDSAEKWMSAAYGAAKSHAETATLNSLMYKIDSVNGRYNEALHKVTDAMFAQDSVTRILLQQSLSIAQKDYYQHENMLQKARLQKQRVYTMSGIVISLLILLSSVLFMQSRKRKKEADLKEQMAQLALIQEEMLKGRSSLIGELFLERTLHLCGLSNRYYTSADEQERATFLSQFKQAARKLKKTETPFVELEKELNRHCSGIMDKLKEQCPNIKRENRKIIALFFAGVPDPLIQMIMNRHSTGSLRTLKSRFRMIIKEASAPDEELFLTMLEAKKQ